jgi:IS30 family transposase
VPGQRGYRLKQAEAKAKAQASQAIRSKPRKLTAPLRCRIEAKLRQMRWSPEQISGWLCEQGIKLSHECIYQMIWQDKRDGGDLWRCDGDTANVTTNVPIRTPGGA